MIGLRGLWLGALRGPWPVQPMKTRGLWPMTTLRGLWPGAVTVSTRFNEDSSKIIILNMKFPIAKTLGMIY